MDLGASSSKHLIFSSGISKSELSDIDGEYVEEHSDEEGDSAGEDDLEEKLKSKGSELHRARIAYAALISLALLILR